MAKGKYQNKANTKKSMIPGIAVGLVIVAVILGWMIAGNGEDHSDLPKETVGHTEPSGEVETKATEPAETILPETTQWTEPTEPSEPVVFAFPVDVSEEDQVMTVTTQYGTVKFSAAFSDVVQLGSQYRDGMAVLQFKGLIGDRLVELFDICYGESDGDLIREITLEDGTVTNLGEKYGNKGKNS